MGLFDIFSAAPGQKAAADQVTAINQGKQDLEAQFGAGRDALNTNYAAALQPYTTNFNLANQGQNSLADALGMNGAAGSARAQQAFTNNPGYKFQLQQGLDAVNAKAAQGGTGASGNNLIDLTKYGQWLAGQTYQNYVQNLQPFLGAANSAAGGIANVDTGLGNALNANYTGVGNALYGADTSIGKAQAGGDMAGYNASGNLLGAGLGLAGDAANLFGGKGSGGMAQSLFSSFLKPQANVPAPT
jgi:hypothetical protein